MLGTCAARSVVDEWLSGRSAKQSNNSTSNNSSDQCLWYESPWKVLSRYARQLYQPVHTLARHWVLNGRQFQLSDIADVLLANATTLLVRTSASNIASLLINILDISTFRPLTLRRAALVLQWVTARGQVNHLGRLM